MKCYCGKDFIRVGRSRQVYCSSSCRTKAGYRKKRNLSLSHIASKDKPDEIRFFEKVKRDKKSGCWLWQGTKNNENKYGVFYCEGKQGNGKRVKAHRWVWEWFWREKIPNGKEIRHRACNQRDCVNPYHLDIGTHKENMQDYVESEEINKNRRIPKSKIEALKEEYVPYDREHGCYALAKRHGINKDYLKRLLNNQKRTSSNE